VGNCARVISPLGLRTTALFDTTDRVRVANRPHWQPHQFFRTTVSAKPAPVTSPIGCVTTTLYDSLNRIRAIIDPFANRTSFSYDSAGLLRMVTDPLNHINTTLYDADGHVRATIDGVGETGPRCRTTRLENLITVKNPLGFVRTTVYDALNRVKALVDPLANRTSFGYDTQGNQNTVKNSLGNVVTSVFDTQRRLGRPRWTPWRIGPVYAYDTSSRLIRTTKPVGIHQTRLFTTQQVGSVPWSIRS